MPNLKGRSFLTLHDFTTEEILYLLDTADATKRDFKSGKADRPLDGRTVAMIFQKPSTRTRVSFQAGIYQLGALAIMLSPDESQLGRGEPLSDTAKVLSRYVDAIVARTYAHSDIEELAQHGSVPVINALTDRTHPCQVLADLQTVRERFGTLAGLKLAYVGDGNNITHSLLLGCAKVGMDIAVATPPGFEADADIVEQATADASGSAVTVTHDPAEAVGDAHVIYTDTWASMGQEEEHAQRLQAFSGFQVNESLMAQARTEAIFMHCLPAHRGEEATDGVLDGSQSVIFDEAENRLHAQKALLTLLVTG